MITATEALQLPTAMLSDKDLEAANELDEIIDQQIRKGMQRNGCSFEFRAYEPTVIAEINQRLKAAGYGTEWQQAFNQHPLNKSINQHVGWRLQIFPTDESYRAAARLALQ